MALLEFTWLLVLFNFTRLLVLAYSLSSHAVKDQSHGGLALT